MSEQTTNRESGETLRFLPDCTEAEAGNYSPLTLAFMGDAVYERMVRTALLMQGNARPNDLNRKKNRLVRASAQSAMMEIIGPLLTEREEAVYRRGRNARSYTMAKNATVGDYRRATGFEALLGYLYLSGQEERIEELVRAGIEGLSAGRLKG